MLDLSSLYRYRFGSDQVICISNTHSCTFNMRFHKHGQWNKGTEDNQKAFVSRRMIYVHSQLWFASPPASQQLVCCCEAKVLLMLWLEWRGAAAHEKRASVTLSLLGMLPNCCWWGEEGVKAGMLPRNAVRWVQRWWIIVLLHPLPSLLPVCPTPHPPSHPSLTL